MPFTPDSLSYRRAAPGSKAMRRGCIVPRIDLFENVAARHDLRADAVRALADSHARGNGSGAQWNHPGLGGMGQWSRGGMIQIGDMFNDGLKARVVAAIGDLIEADLPRAPAQEATSPAWWPGELGRPASSGAQNDMRYACFPEMRRLVVQRGGSTTVYDTGPHRLDRVSQAQGAGQSLAFGGPDGPVMLDELTIVC